MRLFKDQLIRNIDSLVSFGILTKEQGNTSDANWEILTKIESEIVKKHKETEKNIELLKKLGRELTPIKKKLDQQLKIINDILRDPDSINRVESYSNPFNSGNFNNLVLLGTKLKEFNINTENSGDPLMNKENEI